VRLVKRVCDRDEYIRIRCKDDLTCTQMEQEEKLKFECGNMLPKPAATLRNSPIDLPLPHRFEMIAYIWFQKENEFT
jgi:hypothetical protein